MTIKEAIKQLIEIKEYYTPERDFSQYGEDYEPITKEGKEAIDIMINVGEKQVPKKVNSTRCPICKRALRKAKVDIGYTGKIKRRNADKFCPDCGQALDWGDSNE